MVLWPWALANADIITRVLVTVLGNQYLYRCYPIICLIILIFVSLLDLISVCFNVCLIDY